MFQKETGQIEQDCNLPKRDAPWYNTFIRFETGKGAYIMLKTNRDRLPIVAVQGQIWHSSVRPTGRLDADGHHMYLYMSARLGSGPRDGLMCAVTRRCTKIPVGAVRIALEGMLLLAPE